MDAIYIYIDKTLDFSSLTILSYPIVRHYMPGQYMTVLLVKQNIYYSAYRTKFAEIVVAIMSIC